MPVCMAIGQNGGGFNLYHGLNPRSFLLVLVIDILYNCLKQEQMTNLNLSSPSPFTYYPLRRSPTQQMISAQKRTRGRVKSTAVLPSVPAGRSGDSSPIAGTARRSGNSEVSSASPA